MKALENFANSIISQQIVKWMRYICSPYKKNLPNTRGKVHKIFISLEDFM